MKGVWVVGAIIGVLAAAPMKGSAAEHGGKEHAGSSTGVTSPAAPQAAPAPASSSQTSPAASQPSTASATAQTAPTAEQIRKAIRDYIAEIETDEGAYTIDDEVTGQVRTLTLERVHDRVGKTGDLYYSCTDMRDTKTNELLDLDFDVESYDGQLEVVGERIHKVNGQPRYTYDDKDNRIPVANTTAPAPKSGS